MVRFIKGLDKYSAKFLGRSQVFLMDLAISIVCSIGVAIVSFFLDQSIFLDRTFDLVWGLAAGLGSALMYWLLKTYVIVIRHFSFKDTFVLGAAALGKVLVLSVVAILFGKMHREMAVLLLFDMVATIVAQCTVRLLMIYVYDSYKKQVRELERRDRVLIYGIDDKAVATSSRLRGSKRYEVVGLLSKRTDIAHAMIADQKVYYLDSEDEFEQVVNNLSLRGVIFTREQDVAAEKDHLVRFCSERGMKVLIAPAVDEITGAPTPHLQVRDIKIEDLLGRDEIKISMDAIKADFKDKVVMVTGAAGSIGSELCRQLAGFGVRKLLLFDNAETPMHILRLELEERFPQQAFVPIIGDVRQVPRLDFAFRTHRPQVVFHAAAYKHVPLMEENPCEAVLVNVFGSRNVADKCIEYDVEKMVMISTDKAVNPTNIMGCTKRGGGQDEVRDHPLRQRAGQQRLRDPALPRADRARRPRHGHGPEHHPFLHDHSGSLPARDGGGHAPDGEPHLRVRYGQAGQDRRAGAPDDRARGPRARPGHRDRLHGPAPGREALRGGALQQGEYRRDLARPHPHRPRPRVCVRRCRQGGRGARGAEPQGGYSRYGEADEGCGAGVRVEEFPV